MRTAAKSLNHAFDPALVDNKRLGNHRDAAPAPAHTGTRLPLINRYATVRDRYRPARKGRVG